MLLKTAIACVAFENPWPLYISQLSVLIAKRSASTRRCARHGNFKHQNINKLSIKKPQQKNRKLAHDLNEIIH